METVIALLMFVNFEIKEHRIQDSMGMCLRGKREAERQYSETVTYKCIKTKAEIELNIDGTKSIKKIVLK
jgi:membrane-bound inhibitor of C-type lysozyme